MDIAYLDTIAAIATPPGNGGVGIIRISGALVPEIAKYLVNKKLTPRLAQYSSFTDDD
ncbi:MAG: tRNA uridine-5-carboxymethylaminomethyl(34) synthesis GTPase MnmE, partial [Candidatus Paceibacterota bacterium]